MVVTSLSARQRDIFPLNGEWSFALDPQDIGVRDQWYSNNLQAVINVPASWAEQGWGHEPASRYLAGWNALKEYEGAAWYSRTLEIPDTWNNQSVELVLKGVRWRSRVWLDGAEIGAEESLSTPHRYNLTPYLGVGRQRLTIQVDNRMLYPLDESHINSAQTATHWGGITGGVEIIVSPQDGFKSIKHRSDISAKVFHFDITLCQASNLTLEVAVTNPETRTLFSNQMVVNGDQVQISVELDLDRRLWSDDNPFLYSAQFTLKRGETVIDTVEKRIGLREISTRGRQILLNGKPIFLRGYVDCAIFPLTGYPSWDIEHYRRQFSIAKSYGFNHVRLHSWTAPEPFWDAADEMGMLVQTELPHWSAFYTVGAVEPPANVHEYLIHELERIVDELNLHPSWVMFSNGNELSGAEGHARLQELTARGKELDPTHLFTDNTGFGQLPAPSRSVDFFIQSCNWHPPKKIYDAASNDTTQDFNAITAQTDRPLIGHEHGQFTMYVRPSEAEKYTGALRPMWLESILPTFETKQINARLDDYIQASGIHIVRTYKENIERARRTQGLAGLQLLDIRDFPGQGHATTGILDMFWDSKGLIEPQTFAQFNGAVVLLMRTPTPTFWNGDAMVVDIEISNFGRKPINNGVLRWELLENGSSVANGYVSMLVAPMGELTSLCRLKIPTPTDDQAHAFELVVSINDIGNSWHLWSYPYPQRETGRISSRIKELQNLLPDANFSDNYGGTFLRIDHARPSLTADVELAISDRLSQRLLQYLHDGGCVWLMPNASQLYDYVNTRYLPPFWSYLHFPDNVSSVMGMLTKPHPSLANFPHDGMSDWQWYALVNDTPAICLDSVPFIEPIVEVIDNFNRAKRLCYAFEAQVGNGRLFVSTWRLYDPNVSGRPEARFLLREIVRYLRGESFKPAQSLTVGALLGLFKLTNVRALNLE
jgi:beta-galactosidase